MQAVADEAVLADEPVDEAVLADDPAADAQVADDLAAIDLRDPARMTTLNVDHFDATDKDARRSSASVFFCAEDVLRGGRGPLWESTLSRPQRSERPQ